MEHAQQMKPRILLLMDQRDQDGLYGLCGEGSPFTLVGYNNGFRSEDVAGYIQKRRENFDAIAVYTEWKYLQAVAAIEAVFKGPIIRLWKSFSDAPRGSYSSIEVHIPVQPSEFERVVTENLQA